MLPIAPLFTVSVFNSCFDFCLTSGRRHLWAAVWTVVAVASFGVSAGAQSPADTGPSASQMTADLLASLALETLAPDDVESEPTSTSVVPDAEKPAADAADVVQPDQYVRAQILLDLALEQAPDDAGLWRLRADLADRLGDRATQAMALRRYVGLRPEDDAVRLRLIMFELADLETLDGRLALLEQQLADTKSHGHTPALVSRLASSAAQAAHELGDDAKFVKYLRLAGRTETANADAAALMYAFAESRGASPEQLAAAAINRVRADPVGSVTRRLLAARLAGVAAYKHAAKQYDVSSRMPQAAPLEPLELAGWVRALIGAGELEEASQRLATYEAFVQQQANAGTPVPEPPVELTLLRRVLDGEGDAGVAAYERVVAALQPAADSGDAHAALDLAWIIAVFGPDTQPVAELLRDQDPDDPRYARASGFVYLREGADSWARKAFEQVADHDTISAYGLAKLMGRDDAGIARQLREVIRQSPDGFGAALATHQLRTEGRDVPPTAGGRGVVNLINRLPSSLWRFDLVRNPWVGVKATMVRHRMKQFEPLAAEITLQNLTDFPLPLNDSTGVGHTAFVALSLYIGGQPMGSAPTIVVDLGRRLVLMPGERRSFTVRLDRSLFGASLARTIPATVSFNGTFIVGPELNASGGFSTGPLGGIDTVRSAQVLIEPANNQNVTTWIERMTAGHSADDPRVYFAALARTGAAHAQMVPPAVEMALASQAVEALTEVFRNSDVRTRAWILLTLGARDDAGSDFRPLFDQAVRSDEELVRVAHLATHVDDPQAPALTSAIRDGGPRLQRFAEALRDALKRNPGGR